MWICKTRWCKWILRNELPSVVQVDQGVPEQVSQAPSAASTCSVSVYPLLTLLSAWLPDNSAVNTLMMHLQNPHATYHIDPSIPHYVSWWISLANHKYLPSKKLQLLSIGYVCALVISVFPERMSMHVHAMSLPWLWRFFISEIFNQDSCAFHFSSGTNTITQW